MLIEAPAKINLALDVIGDRSDGYHEVDMVMQLIALVDDVILEPAETIELTCSNPVIPLNRKNLAWRAAELLQNVSQDIKGYSTGVKIHIEKRIPVAAGLAGGSSDAAAVLIGLNELWDLGLDHTDLMKLGLGLGADVPFCILKQTARAEGIGERLSLIHSKLRCSLLVITPNIEVSTALVYQSLVTDHIGKHPDIPGVIAALETGDLDRLGQSWGNVLEEVVLNKFPEVGQLKRLLQDFGLRYVLMSGSGPSVFALNPDQKLIDPIREALPTAWFGTVTDFR